MTVIDKKQTVNLLIWSLVWALALIVSAIVFKGNPLKEWIQSALFIAATTFWLWQVSRTGRRNC
jgi:uncharacterized membrane protein YbhN (UPF0104 family)